MQERSENNYLGGNLACNRMETFNNTDDNRDVKPTFYEVYTEQCSPLPVKVSREVIHVLIAALYFVQVRGVCALSNPDRKIW